MMYLAHKHSVSGEVHGNFVACLLWEAGVRALNRDRCSLAATQAQRGLVVPALLNRASAYSIEVGSQFRRW